jgi:PBSX family phage terminase large subunit
MVELINLIAPSFYSVHRSVQKAEYTHFFLGGGRGSTKSSFAGIEIVLGIMNDPAANAVILRKIGATLQNSVYNQILWTIDKLTVNHLFKKKLNPLEFVYLPTGQRIIFHGCDDPVKLKSIKFARGYAKYIWYEEASEFDGMEEIDNLNQSLLRGGAVFNVFYSYNPPRQINSWINAEVLIPRADRLIHKSDYRTVPKDWLGEQFLIEAEFKRLNKPKDYDHEYLGVAGNTGGEVFDNLLIRQIPDWKIAQFSNIRQGLDFGFAADPLVWIRAHYDSKRQRLWIYDEIYGIRLKDREVAELIKGKGGASFQTIADSAEPRSIANLSDQGIVIIGAKKGPDSVRQGIKFLQDLCHIVIDPVRCPNTAREFGSYQLERDKFGNFKSGFPDKDNHSIDASRYGLENDQPNKWSGVWAGLGITTGTAELINTDIEGEFIDGNGKMAS